ncbi:eukaryotic aspartyl protease [Xylariales sp. AK1849]|nr:eukaryotic aspartyl protease [Xylariales sp. AK1849]
MAPHRTPFLTLALTAYCHASTVASRNDNTTTSGVYNTTTSGIYNTTTSGRYVKFPVIHSTNQDVFSEIWANKRGIQTVPLANRSDVAYYARLNIGNPAQPNYVQLDTGSFELWVNPECSNLDSSADLQFCQAVGSYVPASSDSAVVTTSTKTLRYGIGTANIQYVTDDITFAESDTQLQNVQFGVASSTVDEFSGILGIGHGINQTTVYKNFVDELQAQGATATKAFSLALGSKSEQEGVVIFGGLDTGKFAGTLQTQPLIPAAQSPDGVRRYWIDMDFLSLTPPSGQKKTYGNSTMAVFLDSGATLTLLPEALADAVAADFGADSVDSNGFYAVDCALNDIPGTVNFEFPGVTIQVPYNEMIRELSTGFGVLCYLGISPNPDFVLLGDTVLRSAYAVFDQTNDAIHLAQYVNCGTNEVEITTSTNMSAITGQCEQPDFRAAATSSTSSNLPIVTVTSSVGTGTATATAAATSTAGSSSAASISAVSNSWLLFVGYFGCMLVCGLLI